MAVLFIQPYIFHSPAVEQAIDHNCQTLHLWTPAGRKAVVEQNGPGAVFLEFFVDLPYEHATLFLIALHRLPIKERFRLLVARQQFSGSYQFELNNVIRGIVLNALYICERG